MCCVCAGSCNHVGNHSYCVAHGGPSFYVATGTGTGWIYSSPPRCDHCFCEDAEKWYEDHKQCCKCRTRMHSQFIPSILGGDR